MVSLLKKQLRVYWHEKDIYIESVIYQSYLTTTELIEKFKELKIEQNTDILADYSRPEIIAEMQNAGYNVNNANKVVKKGIDSVVLRCSFSFSVSSAK